MTKSFKIIQISNRIPYPLNEGGTIGIYNYTRGFKEANCEVTLLALDAKKHHTDIENAKNELEKYAEVEIYPIDTDVRLIPALKNLFTPDSYNVERFYSKDFELAIAQKLQSNDFDIIQIEGTYPARYTEVILKNKGPAKVVLRQHNVEYQIWERLSKNARNPLKKWYFHLLSNRLKEYEREHLNQFDAVVPVTPDDGRLFEGLGCTKPIFPSPAGIDVNIWKPEKASDHKSIYHIGSLEWMPNVEALMWFLDEVWPLVLEDQSDLKLYVAGKGMPDEIRQMKIRGVTMVGEVDDAPEFIKDKAISIVPLKSGSGIRLKILEAMSAGKAVVSTSIGAQGIDCTDGYDIAIADDAKAFAHQIVSLSSDTDALNEMQMNARKTILEKYSNESVIRGLLDFYQSL